MLTSITPLGERSRGQRYGVTLAFFIGGCVLGGALLGLAAGAVGAVTVPALGLGEGVRLWLLVTLLCAALVIDRVTGRLPGPRRQVNERWLGAYRGWVYGGGFGLQLGLGVATIVTTTGVYLVVAACFAAGSVLGGVVIGASFGTVRALTVLPAARVMDSTALMRLAGALEDRRTAIFRTMTAIDITALSLGVTVALA